MIAKMKLRINKKNKNLQHLKQTKFLLRARVIRLKSLKKKILLIVSNRGKIIYLFKNQTAKFCKWLSITSLQNSMTQ